MADITDKLSDLSKRAVKLRDKDDLPWHEVAGELGVAVGKAMLAYEFGKVKPADRVTAATDEALGKKIVALRDKEGLSWGRISARTGHGEGHCRRLYTAASGTSTIGNRIGKGGRYPGDGNGKTPRKAAAAKKAPAKKTGGVKKAVAKKTVGVKKATGAKRVGGAKKTTAKKAAKQSGTANGRTTTSGGGNPQKVLVEMTLAELQERLQGRKIKIAIGDPSEKRFRTLEVLSVRGLNGDVADVIDAKTGNVRPVHVSAIKAASR